MISIMSSEIFDLLRSSPGTRHALDPGEHLFHLGEPVRCLYLVLEGEAHLVRFGEDGGAVILQRTGPGGVVAEASLFAKTYHCDAVARQATIVQSIPRSALRKQLREEPDFAETFMAHLAQEVQTTRFRAELLSLKTVEARLAAWESWCGKLPPKGEWKSLAQEIGVSPEALYRELARRNGKS
ncbi:MAG: Crp/Fnr family transcriptional regulator [Rhodospirillaceae bacterium]|jgi:CRP/FNR family transcriptional regulator, dissimilatory nitrate respiration regulator|nr:Crp/Fnr family transcriptional regulator [Rhodospirillaceae bacterium]MBT5943489.1 Crp/Fnr family transcriptional regulator [Rhodospirillaceae bacterium]MBT6404953.1 Crp/Fnr family transcriptional regulator [Rhodospirillaceae bacterium]MBT6534844.1 Crp/Fnr family transcriptional regulator [Rhodospirillaceae bacterium]MBT7363039.1 Crp/Fnr family transcriptional regulator [Rhodospirillaceae bacterium]